MFTTNVIPPGQRFRGDGDADNPSDRDGNGDIDILKDRDNDVPVRASYKLPDEDDRAILNYGHPPSAAVGHAVRTIVKHYYKAASTDNGVAACRLLSQSFARSVPEDYGQSSGPSYLRGGTTCSAVLSMLFRHFHDRFASAIEVVAVRVRGRVAQVVYASRTMPAGHIFLTRQEDSWHVLSLIGQALP